MICNEKKLILTMESVIKISLILTLTIFGCESDKITGKDSNVDCAGIVDGNSLQDNCGVCDDDSSNNNTTCEQDCEGTWDGTVENDCRGVCGGTAIDGDVNQTDFLNIADVVYIVHLILGSDLDSACADVNNDGYINISDVVKLVEIVLDF